MLAVIVQQVTRPSLPPRVIGYLQVTDDGRAKAYLNNARPIIVTDGSRIYFTETATGPMRSALYQVSQLGGETSAVPTDLRENVDIGDISPDGSQLFLQSFVSPEPEMRLWTLHATGGAPRRLGDLQGRDPTWSSDGQMIAYAKGNDLYVCKADGSENRRLVSGTGPIRWPRWGPGGSVLRYTRGDPAAATIIEEVSLRGTHPRRLLPGWKGAHCCGNWTADGRYYVFQSAAGKSTDLWLIREKRGLFQRVAKPTRLTAGPIDFQSAVPSRDGTRLFAIGTQSRGELVRYDAKARQFVPYLGGVSAVDIETSRDGRWCVYVSYPSGVLWRSKVDGTERLQLTPPSMDTGLPRWSPDGRRIAFAARTGGEPSAIYLASPEGGNLERVVTEQLNESDPSWSPDGAFLAFGRLPWLEASSSGSPSIQIVNLKTKQVSTLPGSDGLYSPHWSPDGRYMLALSWLEPGMKLFDFNKRTWRELTDIPAAYPNWSGDGQYVHFINPYVAVPALYRLHVSEGAIERIANVDSQQLGWTMVRKWTGLAFDNSPLVLRDTGIQEIFSLNWELP
jgi:Tol biopolymer transport system component